MTIFDVTTPALDYDGEPAVENDVPVTMRKLIFQALNFVYAPKPLVGDESYRAYELTLLVMGNEKVDLSAKDVSFILARSGLINRSLGHGRLSDFLDPKSEPPAAGK